MIKSVCFQPDVIFYMKILKNKRYNKHFCQFKKGKFYIVRKKNFFYQIFFVHLIKYIPHLVSIFCSFCVQSSPSFVMFILFIILIYIFINILYNNDSLSKNHENCNRTQSFHQILIKICQLKK